MIEKQDPARKRITRVFRAFSNKAPFFFSIALHLKVVADAEVQNVAADGVNLKYNPEWVMDASADDLQEAVAHSVTACALKHHTRRSGRSYERWQKASRAVTRPILASAGLADAPNSNQYDKLSAEQAYELFPEDPPNDGKGDGDGQGQGMGMSGGGGGSGLGEVQDYPGEGNSEQNEDSENEQDGKGKGGGGSGNAPGSGPAKPSPQQLKDQEKQWDERLHQAAAISKSIGVDPGMITTMLEDMHTAHMPWQDTLREFMTSVAKRDYTWTRPNRRFVSQDIYLPSLHAEGMGPIVLAIDTSGSMSDMTLKKVWSEIRSIAQDLDPEKVTVIECDSYLQNVTEYLPEELPETLDAKGRGGTEIEPVFTYMATEADSDPACLIYYTDLEFWGATWERVSEPDYPVLWAAYDSPRDELTPPWGERLDVD